MKKLETEWETQGYILYSREVMGYQLRCLLQDLDRDEVVQRERSQVNSRSRSKYDTQAKTKFKTKFKFNTRPLEPTPPPSTWTAFTTFLKIYDLDYHRRLFPPPSLYIHPLDSLKTRVMDLLVHACREGAGYVPLELERKDLGGKGHGVLGMDFGKQGAEVDARLGVGRWEVGRRIRK
jgi:hypothetical protein